MRIGDNNMILDWYQKPISSDYMNSHCSHEPKLKNYLVLDLKTRIVNIYPLTLVGGNLRKLITLFIGLAIRIIFATTMLV